MLQASSAIAPAAPTAKEELGLSVGARPFQAEHIGHVEAEGRADGGITEDIAWPTARVAPGRPASTSECMLLALVLKLQQPQAMLIDTAAV